MSLPIQRVYDFVEAQEVTDQGWCALAPIKTPTFDHEGQWRSPIPPPPRHTLAATPITAAIRCMG